ncbi:5'-3' exonuclease [Ornithinimicrobium cavernae]|uniref:5'-3' exonuclease n=1 Tax=Ornithinimicrobium cavernae TaxID=2666047 RepID=UPI000D691A66|nr:5'-3' exonuclease [Ornithinimicrobium cavernae]
MNPDQRLLLLDTASLYFRAFFGMRETSPAADGTPTNALRGLLDMTATLINRFSPTHLVACWDDDWRPAFRTAAIPSYKAHRLVEGSTDQEEVPADLQVQVPLIRASLEAFGFPVLGSPGYEADDVIGTLVAKHTGLMPVTVVTGDRDLFQLVDDAHQITVAYTARAGVRDAEVIDQEALQERYAVASGQAYADMSIMRGDTSDGLPGVAGIGEKTAAALIANYGSLDGVRQALADGDPAIKGARRKNLQAASDYLDVAPGVVLVARDAPLAERPLTLPRELADPGTLQQFVEAYGISGPVRRLMEALRIG